MKTSIQISPILQQLIEKNSSCFDNWDDSESVSKFYSELPVDYLDEFNKLLTQLDEKIDVTETYRNVFNWLLYYVIDTSTGNETCDLYTEDQDTVFCIEYKYSDDDHHGLYYINLFLQYNIVNDHWECEVDMDDYTRKDYYDNLTDNDLVATGSSWSELANYLYSTLEWDTFLAYREELFKYDPSKWKG